MRLLISLFLVAFITACGFQPMYGKSSTDSAVQERLAAVHIGNIPDQEGQFLRNELIDRFYRAGRPANPAYRLSVSKIRERLVDLDITKSADATRGQLRLDTQIKLSSSKTGEILLERNLTTITSYNILGSEFATRVTEENARQNALNDLARQIELQLGLYFKRD